ncbi:MAG: hypothetical protein ACFFDB_12460 [Promethearchaeota archaeon]
MSILNFSTSVCPCNCHGIELDANIIGNFIFDAITKYPILKILPGRQQFEVFVYSLHKYGENKFLHVIVLYDGHFDGSIITAYPSSKDNWNSFTQLKLKILFILSFYRNMVVFYESVYL